MVTAKAQRRTMRNKSAFISRYLVAGCLTVFVCQAEPVTWYGESFPIQAGKAVLDTAEFDGWGHAAPFLADIDGDAKRDLVVGSLIGKYRFFKNMGTDKTPRFGPDSAWLPSGNQDALVPGACCVAAGARLVDIDGDGTADLSSGSYDPGAIYWFKGLGKARFDQRHMLTDVLGYPIYAYPEFIGGRMRTTADHSESDRRRAFESNIVSNIDWVDWDNDGQLDLLIGNWKGELFVRLGSPSGLRGATALKSQPTFANKEMQAVDMDLNQVRIAGAKAIPDRHSAPSVADWDGDGLWDILVGSYSGRVYLLKNSGKPGQPEFKSRQVLLEPGRCVQWIEPGEPARRGIRTQIHAVDYNLDGKMDLLVGYYSLSKTPRADLTSAEREQMQAIRHTLEKLDRKAGYDHSSPGRRHVLAYWNDKALLQRANDLEQQLSAYLAEHSDVYEDREIKSTQRNHGQVWVFLRQ